VKWQQELTRATASERPITYEWVSATSRHVGTVVHEFLKRGAQADAAIIKPELLRLGVPAADEPAATKQVIRAVTNTLNSTRGQWILAKRADARAEFPIAGKIDNKFITATIDRVFRDDQGKLWIVDYKNSEHKGGSREAFLDEEKRRYRAQLENYGTLISRIENGPVWLGLYFPLLDAWREWQFAEEAAAAN
jgi:ATP-dependent exoDNAse (exonuclease V) beta subunit